MKGNPILGSKIRSRRKELGLTQVEVATDIDIDRSHLSNVEVGRAPIGREALIKLARRLDLSLDFLAAAEGEDPEGAAHARNETEALMLSLLRAMPAEEADALVTYVSARSGLKRN